MHLPPDAKGRPREALLVCTDGEEPKAYLNLCPHLDVPLDSGSADFGPRRGHLVCRTHGARFRVVDGVCTWGPCVGDSLEELTLEREGDVLSLVVDGERVEVARLS